MKHIFVVHSPITYLAALGTILKENLDEKDVLIISEKFSLDYEPIPIVRILKARKKTRLNAIFQMSIQKKLYKYLDENLNGEDFTAYIPVFHNLDRFLVLHRNCKGFNFIEEGLSSYCSSFSLDLHMILPPGNVLVKKNLTSLLNQIKIAIYSILQGYSGKLHAIPTYYISYAHDTSKKFYGFHEQAHKFSENTSLISFKEILSHYKFKPKLNLKNCFIWIGDPDIQELNNITMNEYLEIIRRGYINHLKRNKIFFTYLRFHYRETETQRNLLLNLFEQEGIETIVIPDNIIMEMELIDSENVNLFGFYSSLLFYGKLFGCRSYTIVDQLPNLGKNIDDHLKIFWDFVERIKPMKKSF